MSRYGRECSGAVGCHAPQTVRTCCGEGYAAYGTSWVAIRSNPGILLIALPAKFVPVTYD